MRVFIDRPFKWYLSSEALAVVNRTSDDVFNLLTNVSSWVEWRTPVQVEMTLAEGPLRTGSTFTVSHLVGPVQQEVTTLTPKARLVYEPKVWSGRFRRRTTFDVEPKNGATLVTHRDEVTHIGAIIASVLALLSLALGSAVGFFLVLVVLALVSLELQALGGIIIILVFISLVVMSLKWLGGHQLRRNLERIENVRLD